MELALGVEVELVVVALELTFVVVAGSSVKTALGFAGAFKVGSHAIFSGLGVMKSRSAEAPSVIVDHDVQIQAITVSVYELASTNSSSSTNSIDSGLPSIFLIESSLIVLLSDCFVIFRTTLSGSIDSEKLMRTC